MTLEGLNLQVAYAECFVLAAACVVLLVDLFLKDSPRWITSALTFATLVGAAAITAFVAGVEGRQTALGDMFVADPMGDILKLFLYLTVGLALVYSRDMMTGPGFDLLLRHIEEGGRGAELWRTAARLMRFGEPARAWRLATALAARR